MAVVAPAGVGPFKNEPLLDYSDPERHAEIRGTLAEVRRELGATYPLIVGCEEVRHEMTFASLNPARRSEVIGHHVVADASDVKAALAAATAAFPTTSGTST